MDHGSCSATRCVAFPRRHVSALSPGSHCEKRVVLALSPWERVGVRVAALVGLRAQRRLGQSNYRPTPAKRAPVRVSAGQRVPACVAIGPHRGVLLTPALICSLSVPVDGKGCESLTEWQHDPATSQSTHRRLLTMPRDLTPGEAGSAIRSPGWQEIVATPMTGTPGGQFEYGAYHLCAFVKALQRRLEGVTFEPYLARRVLETLGITLQWRVFVRETKPARPCGLMGMVSGHGLFTELARAAARAAAEDPVEVGQAAEATRGTDHRDAPAGPAEQPRGFGDAP